MKKVSCFEKKSFLVKVFDITFAARLRGGDPNQMTKRKRSLRK